RAAGKREAHEEARRDALPEFLHELYERGAWPLDRLEEHLPQRLARGAGERSQEVTLCDLVDGRVHRLLDFRLQARLLVEADEAVAVEKEARALARVGCAERQRVLDKGGAQPPLSRLRRGR